jgi:hypothetical protein
MSKDPNKKQQKVVCSGCRAELDSGHGGLSCPQGHHLCLDVCSSSYVDLMLAEPPNYFPPKCPDCRVEINPAIFDRILTPDKLDRFNDAMFEHVYAKQCVGKGEVLCQCPFCKYVEIRAVPDTASIMFVYCKRAGCSKTTCYVCNKELMRRRHNTDEADDDGDENEINVEMDAVQVGHDVERGDASDDGTLAFHMKCSALAAEKQKFDDVIKTSVGVPCPGCGIIGRKDDACNHMGCQNCQTSWCYMCGKKESELDISAERSGIYGHFVDWETNSKRCPMYLCNVCDADDDWPEDPYEALNFFHRERTLRLLNKLHVEIGDAKWTELENHFATIRNCGFTKEDFMAVPHDKPLYHLSEDQSSADDSDSN